MTLPAVVLIDPKYSHNLAAAIRACSCFGVSTLFWTGNRFAFKDGDRLPREERMKGYADVTVRAHQSPMNELYSPHKDRFLVNPVPVCVELTPSAMPLTHFAHPEDAIYLFGPEDGSVPQVYRRFCHSFVYIPSRHCLNLAAAVNVVLYDRATKLGQEFSTADYEKRGIEVPGWDGK